MDLHPCTFIHAPNFSTHIFVRSRVEKRCTMLSHDVSQLFESGWIKPTRTFGTIMASWRCLCLCPQKIPEHEHAPVLQEVSSCFTTISGHDMGSGNWIFPIWSTMGESIDGPKQSQDGPLFWCCCAVEFFDEVLMKSKVAWTSATKKIHNSLINCFTFFGIGQRLIPHDVTPSFLWTRGPLWNFFQSECSSWDTIWTICRWY